MDREALKVLVITNLFPNIMEPTRGTYNRQQCLELSKICELKIVAPLPWMPLANIFAPNAPGARVPEYEMIDGVDVYHPRYFMTPKVGRSFYGYFFFLSLLGKIKEIYKTFRFDVIYAPWVYPDGVGSRLIARVMRKPIILGALGSDVNIFMSYFMRGKIIAGCLKDSDGVIAVSKALKDKMMEHGVPENKICVLTNGVNTELFKPLDKGECRKKLNIAPGEKAVLYVGNLVRGKGLNDLLEAFMALSAKINELRLIIVGDGPLKESLMKKFENKNAAQKVRFAGKQPHDSIPLWMNACDVFCLPSHYEGCPNVVLEAMACGAPVVAARVGGIPELIVSGADGILVPPRQPRALSEAIENLLGSREPKTKVRPSRVQNWPENARKLFEQLKLASLR